jgi:hypothetical protein
MGNPMHCAEELEEKRHLFNESWERFRGYGVMGLPFASGHVLAFRRMADSSLGPAFTSIWHRDPAGTWTMMVSEDPWLTCPRFFGSAVDRVVHTEIDLSWDEPMRLSLRVPEERVQWGIRLSSDFFTRSMSWAGRVMPGRVRRSRWVLGPLGRLGGRILGLGHLSLAGVSPNGQRYVAFPRLLWRIEASAAVVNGQELGPIGPLPRQARLGQFPIPNGGVFAFGEAAFERLDRSRHSVSVTRWTREDALAG